MVFATATDSTIAGTIRGDADNEGTIQVTGTGATKTFSGTIGASSGETGYALTLIDIDSTSIFMQPSVQQY